jgi:hypothetical protein
MVQSPSAINIFFSLCQMLLQSATRKYYISMKTQAYMSWASAKSKTADVYSI